MGDRGQIISATTIGFESITQDRARDVRPVSFLPGPLPGVPAEDVSLVGLDEDVVPPDVVQDLPRRRLRQVGQRVALRLKRKDKGILS